MAPAAADRDHEASALGKLLDQRIRDLFCGRSDDDAIIRCTGGPAFAAVPADELDIVDAKGIERAPRVGEQLGDDLDRVDLPRELRQDRGLVARASADFENGLVAAQPQRFDGHGHHQRL